MASRSSVRMRLRADTTKKLVPTYAPGAYDYYSAQKKPTKKNPNKLANKKEKLPCTDNTLNQLHSAHKLVKHKVIESITYIKLDEHALNLLLNRTALRFIPMEPRVFNALTESRDTFSPGSTLCAVGTSCILPMVVYTPILRILLCSNPNYRAGQTKATYVRTLPATVNSFELLSYYVSVVQFLRLSIDNAFLDSPELANEILKLQRAEEAPGDAEPEEDVTPASMEVVAQAAVLFRMSNQFEDELTALHAIVQRMQYRVFDALGTSDEYEHAVKHMQTYTVSILNIYEHFIMRVCNMPKHAYMLMATPTVLPSASLNPTEHDIAWYVKRLCDAASGNRACLREFKVLTVDAKQAAEKAEKPDSSEADKARAKELAEMLEHSGKIIFCRTFDCTVVPDEMLQQINGLDDYVKRILLPTIRHTVEEQNKRTEAAAAAATGASTGPHGTISSAAAADN